MANPRDFTRTMGVDVIHARRSGQPTYAVASCNGENRQFTERRTDMGTMDADAGNAQPLGLSHVTLAGSAASPDCVHHMRIEEATGKNERVMGECLKCGWSRMYDAWIDPYENMNHGDLMHDIIFGFTRPGDIRD